MKNPTITKYHSTARGVYTAGQLAEGWRRVKAAPAGSRMPSPFSHFTETREDVLRRLAEMVSDGINAAAGIAPATQREIDVARFARQINAPRLAVHRNQCRHIPARIVRRVSPDRFSE